MNLYLCYICRMDTQIFLIFHSIRMLQVSKRSIRQYRKHNFPSMDSSVPCLQKYLQLMKMKENLVHKGKIQTGVEKKWKGMMDNSGVI